MIGKSLIAGTPVDATDGTFTAGGALAQFEEASGAHVDRALEAAALPTALCASSASTRVEGDGGDLEIVRPDRFSPSLERTTDLGAFHRTGVIER